MKWFSISLILFASAASADFNSNARGTTTANFLKLGVGARAVAMGEAFSAVADDATALYWNPAGLARLDKRSATFMHAPYLESSFYDYGAYAQRSNRHAWGAGIQYFSAGRIPETDEFNNALGSFSPYDLAASLGYAYRLSDRLSEEGYYLGVTGKFIQSKILATASTVALDAGFQTPAYGDRLRLAFAITNLGGTLKFEEEAEHLPLALRLGSALQLTEKWLASLDVAFPKDNSPYAAVGAEYQWHATESLKFAGRMGYNSRTTGDIDGLTGLSFGFGAGLEKIAFDYAFLPYGILGLTHRISLTLEFE